MGKNKYDFIQDLLTNKKLSTSQREKVLKLTAEEIKKDKELGIALEERVKKLEGRKDIKKHTVVPKKRLNYINPIDTFRFLFELNEDPILRTICHDLNIAYSEELIEILGIDQYDFETHQKEIRKSYNIHQSKFESKVSEKLTALIYYYINGSDEKNKEWSSDKIQFNWARKELTDWAKDHGGIPPSLSEKYSRKAKCDSPDIKVFTSKLTEDTITNFTGLVLHFKKLFRITHDAPLKPLLEIRNKAILENNKVKIVFKEFEKVELYTDVDKLIQAYGKLVNLILEKHFLDEIPIIELSFYKYQKKKNTIHFVIHHLNTHYKKSAEEAKQIGDSMHVIISNQLNGICNFHINADFLGEEVAWVNLWDGKERRAYRKDAPKTKGVKYILEFVQKKSK